MGKQLAVVWRRVSASKGGTAAGAGAHRGARRAGVQSGPARRRIYRVPGLGRCGRRSFVGIFEEGAAAGERSARAAAGCKEMIGAFMVCAGLALIAASGFAQTPPAPDAAA